MTQDDGELEREAAEAGADEGVIDANWMRDRQILQWGLSRANLVYTIYYDETNNIRRLHVRSDGLNIAEPKCFVIGGIAHRGDPRDLKLEELRQSLRLQKTVPEIKLEYIAKGDFVSLLSSRKLEIFLRWLLDHELLLHYSVLDPLYWSIVDIVDSILANHPDERLDAVSWNLKNDLYTILRHDRDGTIDLFRRYSYPNVGRERSRDFVVELREMLEARRQLLSSFNFMMLKGVLEVGERLESLPFLEDETPNVLIDGFGMFFVNRICLFKSSTHVLDVENVIENYIGRHKFMDGAEELHIYRFANSVGEPGVQISDVIVGLLGKFFSMIVEHEVEELRDIREALDQQQSRNLACLRKLLDRSLEENGAFVHRVLSLNDQRKADWFLEG